MEREQLLDLTWDLHHGRRQPMAVIIDLEAIIDACVAEALADPLTVMERAAKLTDVVEVQWDSVQGGFYYTAYGDPCTRAEAAELLKETR